MIRNPEFVRMSDVYFLKIPEGGRFLLILSAERKIVIYSRVPFICSFLGDEDLQILHIIGKILVEVG